MKSEEIIQESSVDGTIGEIYRKYDVGTEGRLQSVSNDVLNKLNIDIEARAKEYSNFIAMRDNLENEPGVIISNHPSSLDIFVVLSNIRRDDLLIMVQKKRLAFFKQAIGSQKVIAAPSGTQEMDDFLELTQGHITKGGVFLLFPSGGAEITTNEFAFRSGFKLLLPRLKPMDMVYSFYIEPEAGRKITTDIIGPPKLGEGDVSLVAPKIHARPAQDKLIVPVDEKYSQAESWQELVLSDKDNSIVTERYLSLFQS